MRIFKLTSFLSALLITAALTAPTVAPAQISVGVGVNITVAPPAIPVYVQPALPAVGYMWIPGYWQWGDDGYFWVPGTWVAPPTPGLLWTPGYWGWNNGVFAWNGGYWGAHIGFYGGVNYGFGYGGVGFAGGEWRNGGFFYNRAVVNIGTSVHVTNVYNKTVIVNETNVTRVSYNGGEGGLKAAPTTEERAAMQEHHTPPTSEQEKNVTAAKANPALRASANHGKPAVAATAKPGVFKGKGVVAAHGAAPASKAEAPAKPTASHENVAHPAPAKPAAKPAKPEEPKPEAKTEEPKPAAPKPAAKPAAPKPAAKPAAPKPAPAKPAPKPEEKKE